MVKHLSSVIRVFIAVVVLLSIGLVAWLQTAKRDFSWLRPVIIQEFSEIAPDYSLDIGHVSINWQDLSKLGSVHVEQLRINDAEGNVFALFPEIDFRLNLWHLIVGGNALDTVQIYRPLLLMTREIDGQIQLGLKENNANVSLAALLKPILDSKKEKNEFPFAAIEIYQAQFLLRDVKTESQLTSEDFDFTLAREGDAYAVQFRLPVRMDNRDALAEGSARRLEDTSQWAVNVHFDAWGLDWVCKFAQCGEGNELRGLATGKLSATISKTMALNAFALNAQAKDMQLAVPEWFEKTLRISDASIDVSLSDNLRQLTLSQLSAQLANDGKIHAQADLHFDETTGWVGNAKASTANVKAGALRKYWPVHLAPMAREWSISNLTKGYAEKADIAITLKPGYTLQEILPDDAMLANVEVRGMKVHFLPGFPDLQAFDGSVVFTGQTMNVVAKKATTAAGSVLENIVLTAPDLNHPNTPIETHFDVDASAKDVASVLQLPYFTFDDAITLDPQTISGRFKGNAKISFDAYSGKTKTADDIDFSSVKYSIDAKVIKGAQKRLNSTLDVADLNADIHLENDAFNAKGAVNLSGHALQFNASQENAGDVMLSANGAIARKDFKDLGLPDTDYITEGMIGIDAEAALRKSALILKRATLDLKHSAWNIPEISWHKPEKIPGKIQINVVSEGEYRVQANSDDLHAQGTMRMGGASGLEVVSASFPRIESNLNDFGIRYGREGDGYAIDLYGKRLDASAAYAEQENSLLQDFPPIRLKLDLAELVLAPQAGLQELKGNLQCNQQRCESADIRGKANGTQFTATIGYEKGMRNLAIKADNAGDFIRALDISDRVFDGTLSLTGNYLDTQTPAPLHGRLIISDFTLKNSQILGRILSIGSLTGLANALTGSGIAIEKLGADIEALKGRILVKNGKADGNAMGFTTEGVVDTATSDLRIKGVLVPAFIINSVVNSIPLIGMLAGGEGEGLIAFRYSIDGKYSDPDVMVNPLSGLTPGFLRGIFGVFDDAAPKIEREGESKPEPIKK